MHDKWETYLWYIYLIFTIPARYRFTKGLTQNLNLRTHLMLKYNIKSLI